MTADQVVFLHSAALERTDYPAACPFRTARAARTRARIEAMGMLEGADRCEAAPRAATRDELETFHAPSYLDALRDAASTPLGEIDTGTGLGTPDCPVFAGMYEHAALAAGASLTGARLILEGRARAAFNPSGGFHHAGPARAAGFCYLNDVVLAARLLAAAGRRVCFLDIDVHHGDGVQEAFYDRADVLTVSLHESGRTLFPGTGNETETGIGAGRGYALNLPFPAGAGDAVYERAFREAALPVILAYEPDVVIIELGMDALAGDPLGHLHLTNNVHADILQKVMDLGQPVLATGGGGYNVENTVRGWALCWSVLCGDHAHQQDLMAGMGGVMLENTDWLGGLRDRVLLSDAGHRQNVDAEIDRVISVIRSEVFPVHGL